MRKNALSLTMKMQNSLGVNKIDEEKDNGYTKPTFDDGDADGLSLEESEEDDSSLTAKCWIILR